MKNRSDTWPTASLLLPESVRPSKGRRGVTEKKMFGGVAFLLHGNMCVGVWQTSMIVRLGPDQAAAALKEPNVV